MTSPLHGAIIPLVEQTRALAAPFGQSPVFEPSPQERWIQPSANGPGWFLCRLFAPLPMVWEIEAQHRSALIARRRHGPAGAALGLFLGPLVLAVMGPPSILFIPVLAAISARMELRWVKGKGRRVPRQLWPRHPQGHRFLPPALAWSIFAMLAVLAAIFLACFAMGWGEEAGRMAGRGLLLLVPLALLPLLFKERRINRSIALQPDRRGTPS
jgi:hypothetical protein